jgi:hypothetical protein
MIITIEPEAPEETATTEAAPAAPADTLPAVLTKAEITEARLKEIEGWKNMVVADPLDKASAKLADERRLQAKKARTTATRICKDEREEAVKVQKWWVQMDKDVAGRIEPVEAHLQAIVDRYDAAVLAVKKAKIQARLDALAGAGMPPDLARATDLSDEAWDSWFAAESEATRKRNAAMSLSDELTTLGDFCTLEEALELSPEEGSKRLDDARAAKLAKDELDRQTRETERIARERLERGALRVRDLGLVGVEILHEEAADLSVEEFAARMEDAKEARRLEQEELAALRAQVKPAAIVPFPTVVKVAGADGFACVTMLAPSDAAIPEPRRPVEGIAESPAAAALVAPIHQATQDERTVLKAWIVEARRALPDIPVIKDPRLLAALAQTTNDIEKAWHTLSLRCDL